MIKQVLFLVLGCLVSNNAYGSEQLSGRLAGFYFAVGLSSNTDPVIARKESCAQARIKLAEYVFGATYQINQNMIRTVSVIHHSQDIVSKSGEILFRGTTEKITQQGELTNCVLNYPETEAEIEQKRLSTISSFNSPKFTSVGDPNNIRGGTIEVISVPEDIPVFIDNERWGTTPLRLFGKITLGKHRLRLDHPSFTPIEEEFELQELAKVRFDRMMTRANGFLRIESTPERAEISINDEILGYTPKEISVTSGIPIRITLRHVNSDETYQQVELQRNERKTLKVFMAEKPGYVSFNVIPSESVFVEVDKTSLRYQTNQWIKVTPGEHEFLLKAPGYSPKRLVASISAGEKIAFPTIQLAKSPPLFVSHLLGNLTIKLKSPIPAMIEIMGPVQRFALGTRVAFNDIPAGLYALQISAEGYEPFQTDIELKSGENKIFEKTIKTQALTPDVIIGVQMEGVLGASTGFGVGFSLEKGPISLFQERDLGLKVNLLSRNGTERLLQIGTPFYFSRNLYFLPQHTRNLFQPQLS